MRLTEIRIEANLVELVISPNSLRLVDDGEPIELAQGIQGLRPNDATKLDAKIEFHSSSEHGETLLHQLRIVENTDYDFSLTINRSLREFKQELKKNGGAYPFRNTRLINYVSLNAPSAWSEISSEKVRLTGRINFRNFAGTADLSLAENFGSFKLYASVLTEKLTDDADLFGILGELSNLCTQIIFQIDSPTEVPLTENGEDDDGILMFVFHLRRLLRDGRFSYAINQILARPASRNRKARKTESIALANEIDLVEIASNPLSLRWVKGGALSNRFRGYTPEQVPVVLPEVNYNIPENQYVKSFLVNLASRIDVVNQKIGIGSIALKKDLTAARDYILSALESRFWLKVSAGTVIPYSMIMQQRTGYRDFSESTSKFGIEATLLRTLMSSEELGGELKPVWHLYQIWCCVQLIKALNMVCGKSVDESIEKIFSTGIWGGEIAQKKPPLISWVHIFHEEEVRINLFYNKRFGARSEVDNEWSGSYSLPYIPDISIEISLKSRSHWLHFDAKYRVDRNLFSEGVVIDRAKVGDLEKMHAYRDAVLGTRGSYVLFPSLATDVKIYVRNPVSEYREVNDIPSIGAFPLHPGVSETLNQQLLNISDFISNAARALQTSTYQEELGLR